MTKGGIILAGLVPHAAALGRVLAATHDVPDQAIPAEQAFLLRCRGCRFGREPLLRAAQAGLDQRPASADPVTIATVDEFVRATREASFRRILTGR